LKILDYTGFLADYCLGGKIKMKTLFASVLFMLGAASLALAIDTPPAPEISPASGVSALALLSGALLVFRTSRKKR
jgi:hypothetical protein